jgi:hypothetical protein
MVYRGDTYPQLSGVVPVGLNVAHVTGSRAMQRYRQRHCRQPQPRKRVVTEDTYCVLRIAIVSLPETVLCPAACRSCPQQVCNSEAMVNCSRCAGNRHPTMLAAQMTYRRWPLSVQSSGRIPHSVGETGCGSTARWLTRSMLDHGELRPGGNLECSGVGCGQWLALHRPCVQGGRVPRLRQRARLSDQRKGRGFELQINSVCAVCQQGNSSCHAQCSFWKRCPGVSRRAGGWDR